MTTSPQSTVASGGTPMRAAHQPTGAGRIGVVGPLLAAVLTGAGVVLVHDAIARADHVAGRTWLAAASDGLNRLTAEWWMIPLGVVLALIGIWLMVTALRPRSRKTVPVSSATGVFLRTRDVARLASAAADDVDGVRSAGSVASRRTVTVTVESDTPGIAGRVEQAVGQRLSALSDPLKIKVRVRTHQRREEAK